MLSYEERLARAKNLYTAILKTIKHLLRENAEEWLKRFRHEPWYEAAVEAYVQQAQLASDVFDDLKRRVLQTIDREDLYQVLPEPPKLGGGIKRKPQGITRYKTWEYLDERYNRVVVDDVRDELVELQKDFRQKLDECYQKVMIDTLVPETGKALYDHLDMIFDFNRYDEATRDYLRDKKIRWRNQVADETEREIKAQLVKGYEEGLSSYAIAENIGQSSSFKVERAEKIARTEVMSACNYAQYAAAEIDDDVVGHYWRSQGTARSRMSHRRANGQYRPKGEPFTIGGAKMMYPGDGSLGAPAKEIINCRCWLEMVFVGEEPAGAARQRSAETEKADKALYAQYQKVLQGTNLVKSFAEFQEMRYTNGAAWKALREQYRLSRIIERERLASPFSFDVDQKHIRSEKYKKRFQNLFDNPRTNEAVYKAAKMMLQHRDGTPFEDMYLIDEATGAIVGVSNSDSRVKGVVYNSSIKKALERYGKNTLIALHNHPQGFPPSASDLNAVRNNEAVRCGMTIGHNGTIYKYTQPKKWITEEAYTRVYEGYKKLGYSEETCQEKTLKSLQEEYGFKLEVL